MTDQDFEKLYEYLAHYNWKISFSPIEKKWTLSEHIAYFDSPDEMLEWMLTEYPGFELCLWLKIKD